MSILNDISENIQEGRDKLVKELVQKALDEGISADSILNDGLLDGMGIVGEKFRNNEFYVPDVMVAARAMSAGSEILKPHLAASGVKATGKAVLGTVAGDLHDIGKNLVRMMMEGRGIEVIDLGVDVSAEKFVQTAIEEGAQIIGCSALLTTTMNEISGIIAEAVRKGIRENVTFMIGGAPVTDAFAKQVGADIYTPDAATAAEMAVKVCSARDGH